MLRDRDSAGLLYLARARDTAKEMPSLAASIAEEWALWHWQQEGRLLHLFGDDDIIRGMALSPDGEFVATGSVSGTARIWSLRTGRQHGASLEHGSPIGVPRPSHWSNGRDALVVFSEDSSLLAVGSQADGTITVWDVASSEQILPPLWGGKEITELVFSGTLLRALTHGNPVTLSAWDLSTGQPAHEPRVLGTDENSGTFVFDGAYVVSGLPRFQGFSVWNVETLEEEWRWPSGGGSPSTFDSSGDHMVFGLFFQTSLSIRGRDGSETAGLDASGITPRDPSGISRVKVRMSPNGKALAAIVDGGVRLHRVPSGEPFGKVMPHDGWVARHAFNATSDLLATGAGRTVRVWDVETNEEVIGPLTHPASVIAVAFHPSDPHILATQSKDSAIRVWNVGPIRRRHTLVDYAAAGIDSSNGSVAFSPDGTMVASLVRETGAVRIWDARTRAELQAMVEPDGRPRSVVFTPDSRRVVTTTVRPTSNSWTFTVWDAASGETVARRSVARGLVFDVAFQGRSSLLWAVGGFRSVETWDIDLGSGDSDPIELADLWGVYTGGVSFSADGSLMALGDFLGKVEVWDMARRQPLPWFHAHDGVVNDVALSPDGLLVGTASDDSVAQLWDVATGKPVGPPLLHTSRVSSLAFSRDGRFVVTTSTDKTAQIWETTTSTPMGSPLLHDRPVAAAEFSPDSRTLATVSLGEIALWDLPVTPATTDEIDRKTALATGVRLSEDDQIELLPWREWQRLADGVEAADK